MRIKRIVGLLFMAIMLLALAGCGLGETVREKIKYDNGDQAGGNGFGIRSLCA